MSNSVLAFFQVVASSQIHPLLFGRQM